MLKVGDKVFCETIQSIKGCTHEIIGFFSDGWACIDNVRDGHHGGINYDLVDENNDLVKNDPRKGQREFYLVPPYELLIASDIRLKKKTIKHILKNASR